MSERETRSVEVPADAEVVVIPSYSRKTFGDRHGVQGIVLFLTIAFIWMVMAIAAITVGSLHSCTDAETVPDVPYKNWLYTSGQVALWSLAFVVFLLAISSCCGNLGGATDSDIWYWLAKITFIVAMLFQFAWYIVGAIAYFDDVLPDCANSNSYYTFGMVYFIFETIVMLVLVGFFVGWLWRRWNGSSTKYTRARASDDDDNEL